MDRYGDDIFRQSPGDGSGRDGMRRALRERAHRAMAVTVHGGRRVRLKRIDRRRGQSLVERARVVVRARLRLDQIAMLAYGVANRSLVKDREKRRNGEHRHQE